MPSMTVYVSGLDIGSALQVDDELLAEVLTEFLDIDPTCARLIGTLVECGVTEAEVAWLRTLADQIERTLKAADGEV